MALALGPELLIADEPTSALDVTVQAQILELLAQLQQERGMALILVSHDMGVIAEQTDEVVVMYAGRIVEHGTGETVIGSPLHPYTRGLLSSIPHVDGPRTARLTPVAGSPPSAVFLPSGCAFHPRCALARPSCTVDVPELAPVSPRHRIACPVVAGDASLVSAS
jgi:oligopeptide/dipeptide ABC transporter ATP-binding protein